MGVILERFLHRQVFMAMFRLSTILAATETQLVRCYVTVRISNLSSAVFCSCCIHRYTDRQTGRRISISESAEYIYIPTISRVEGAWSNRTSEWELSGP